ncbi:MAG: class I SAM-dependent methyltransferase [Salinivirgaceae bacterium]|nr:MAG: class I SAM-dependent methyltransferase [Salinivirgaceae bacterium]
MKFSLREKLFQMWYWYVNKVDKNAEILFMNYGYHNENEKIQLSEKDENNRYSIQLYDHLASAVELKGRDIIEIGCGRGGGLSHVVENHKPGTARGVDLDKRAVDFSNNHYNHEGLSFYQGDAQKLHFEDHEADAILNVESSHRYPDMMAFLGEVKRILRPGGYFLYTDFRYDHEMDELKKQLAESGLSIEKEKVINNEVLEALRLDDPRKRKLVKKLAPKFLHKVALNFAGTIGSETYRQIESGKYVYYSYVLRKN